MLMIFAASGFFIISSILVFNDFLQVILVLFLRNLKIILNLEKADNVLFKFLNLNIQSDKILLYFYRVCKAMLDKGVTFLLLLLLLSDKMLVFLLMKIQV